MINTSFVKAKVKQAALFGLRICFLTINCRAENRFLRENGFILFEDMTPMQLHNFYFKVYSDGTSGG